MEKNIDVVIDRRFKKHGMSWTTEGVNNFLKLRTLCYNKNNWEAFWRKQSISGGELLLQLINTTWRFKGWH